MLNLKMILFDYMNWSNLGYNWHINVLVHLLVRYFVRLNIRLFNRSFIHLFCNNSSWKVAICLRTLSGINFPEQPLKPLSDAAV